jgi:flagellin
MSASTIRQLGIHYTSLSRSVERLSSGLRVNKAADDAAGLSIRELMRADIAGLNQGVRNANDSVSMIQTADGALQVIDEKLIRMKELAEQAATGTYTSDQRLIIDSEYQQMAKEISRIANAADFNGIHLLNGNLESGYHNGRELTSTGELKVHFGTGNDSAEDYYYVQIDDMTAEGISLGDGGTAAVAKQKLERKFVLNLEELLKPRVDSGEITEQQYEDVITEVLRSTDEWTRGAIGYYYTPADFQGIFQDAFGATTVPRPRDSSFTGPEGFTYVWLEGMDTANWTTIKTAYDALTGDEKEKYRYAFLRESVANMRSWLVTGNIFTRADDFGMHSIDPSLQGDVQKAGLAVTQWFAARHTYAGQNIRSQENAQHALEAVDAGIIIKDKVRASLGATQNRLENTVSNLMIQAENLQAAESRISDVDVATEMTEYTRNRILIQAATSMLAQANSMSSIALSLIQR